MPLTLTDNASMIVKAIAEQTAGTTVAGLRISLEQETATDFDISVVPDAEDGDTIVESDGARVFLDVAAAQVLTDAVLDAEVDDEGSVQFSVGTQD
ncbi:Fe-S cluster assembly protein HesB [Marisediminicola sp. LYQ134]|uniref:Fe-S cluster assembly protein HesB n=1 Tax=unclassified Marisediminicola TaxID=2618316 RepID=UPI00398379EB